MSVHVTIEHGIPIPPRPARKRSDSLCKSLEVMDVGDSFAIDKKHYNAVRTAAFKTRTKIEPRPVDGTLEMIRIWKTGMKSNGITQ